MIGRVALLNLVRERRAEYRGKAILAGLSGLTLAEWLDVALAWHLAEVPDEVRHLVRAQFRARDIDELEAANLALIEYGKPQKVASSETPRQSLTRRGLPDNREELLPFLDDEEYFKGDPSARKPTRRRVSPPPATSAAPGTITPEVAIDDSEWLDL